MRRRWRETSLKRDGDGGSLSGHNDTRTETTSSKPHRNAPASTRDRTGSAGQPSHATRLRFLTDRSPASGSASPQGADCSASSRGRCELCGNRTKMVVHQGVTRPGLGTPESGQPRGGTHGQETRKTAHRLPPLPRPSTQPSRRPPHGRRSRRAGCRETRQPGAEGGHAARQLVAGPPCTTTSNQVMTAEPSPSSLGAHGWDMGTHFVKWQVKRRPKRRRGRRLFEPMRHRPVPERFVLRRVRKRPWGEM